MSMGKFPEQRYLWRCPTGCGFTAPRREDWDDSPGAKYCAHCGVPLERVSCPHCDAPIMWHQIPGQNPGEIIVKKAEYCAFCGGKTEVAEKQMRRKPPGGFKDLNLLYGDTREVNWIDDKPKGESK